MQQANGAGQPVTIWQGPNPRFPYAWMDGDSRLLFAELKDAALDIGIIDTAAGGRERMVLASPWNETRPDVSPDGRWLAYTSNESGRDEVYVRPLPDITAGKWQVSTGGGHSPAWIPGGGELVFRAPGQMMSVAVRSGEAFSAGPPTSLFDDVYVNDIGGRSFDLARDGRLLMLRDEGSTTDQIEIIFNTPGRRRR